MKIKHIQSSHTTPASAPRWPARMDFTICKTMEDSQTTGFAPSKLFATIWFTVAFVIYALSVIPSFYGRFLLTPSIAGVATIVLMVARQRTKTKKIDDKKFNQIVLSISCLVVFLSALSTVNSQWKLSISSRPIQLRPALRADLRVWTSR